ncbi:MAG: M20/M25/M40 family metallo-hydrolase [Pseudomonadota bacterium]
MRLVVFWVGLFCVSTGLAEPATPVLDATETRIVERVNANADQLVVDLERHVNINSGTMNHAGVREVGSDLARRFESIGFSTEWVELPESTNRAGHLIASYDGDPDGPKILAIGHLDTVFEQYDPFNEFSRKGDIARGPGVDDMKSGNLIAFYALRALAESEVLDRASYRVVFTGDEESPGEPLDVVRADLIEAGQWADFALGFEAGAYDRDSQGRITTAYATTARRSSSDWMVEVTGKQAHSSGIFSDRVGAGAVFEAARILNAFYETVRGEEYLTFNAGSILAGTDIDYDVAQTRGTTFGKTNVVPSHAIIHGGIRTISDAQLERARTKMREIIADNLPGTSATITFGEGYPAMAPTEGNMTLQRMLSDINIDLGGDAMPALDPSRRGAADISFVASYADSLAGLGAYGSGAHSPGEALDLSSLPIATQRAALLIYRLQSADSHSP